MADPPENVPPSRAARPAADRSVAFLEKVFLDPRGRTASLRGVELFNLRLVRDGAQVHDLGDLVRVTAGTVGHVEVVVLHDGLGHGAATGESATAAVGVRQTRLHQIDARILLHMEEFRNKV